MATRTQSLQWQPVEDKGWIPLDDVAPVTTQPAPSEGMTGAQPQQDIYGPPEPVDQPPQTPQEFQQTSVERPEMIPGRPQVPGRPTLGDIAKQQKQQMEANRIALERQHVVVQDNRKKLYAEVRSKLGDDTFDESQALAVTLEDMAKGDFKNALVRMDMQRSDKFNEFRRKLLSQYPKADLQLVKLSGPTRGASIGAALGIEEPPNDTMMVYRPSKYEPWRPVDPQAFDMLSDLADILPNVFNEENFGTMVGTLLTSGAGKVARVLGPMIGDALGVYAHSLVETNLRGVNESTSGEVASKAAIDAGLTGIFAKLFSFRKTLGDNYKEAANAADLAEFARRQDIKPPVIGQQATNPLVTSAWKQVSTVIEKASEIVKRQKSDLLAALERQTAVPEGMNRETILAIDEKRRAEANAAIRNLIAGKEGERADWGDVTSKIIKDYWDSERQRIGKLYDATYAHAPGVSFDISTAAQLAEKEAAPILGAGKPKTQTVTSQGEGGFVFPQTSTQETVSPVQIKGPSAEFKEAVNTLISLDPKVAPFEYKGITYSPFEIVKALRSKFFILSQPGFAERRTGEEEAARKIYSALTEAMDNPNTSMLGGNAKKEFTDLHTAAREANRNFENLMERGMFKQILGHTNNPSSDISTSFAEQMARPGRQHALETIGAIANPAEWELFKQGYVNSLMADPTTISAKMNAWAKSNQMSSLRQLISRGDEMALRAYGDAVSRIEASPIKNALTSWGDSLSWSKDFVKSATREDIADAVEKAGGKNSDFAKSLKGGVYKDILEQSTEIGDGGRRMINVSKATDLFSKYENEGKIFSFMTPKEMENFKNFGSLASVFQASGDVGASLRAAGISSGLRFVLKPTEALGKFMHVLSDDFYASVLMLPAGQRFLSMSGNIQPGTAKAVRAAAILTSEVAANAQRQSAARRTDNQ